MAVGLGEGNDLVLDKDRTYDAHFVEVSAPHIRVVYGEVVARVDVVLEGLDHSLGCEAQCTDVDGDVLAPLPHSVPLRIADGVRKVPRPDQERVARPQDLLG